MVTTSSILHETMVADRQREMRDKAAHHRCLLDAEAALERPGFRERVRGRVAAILTRALPSKHGVPGEVGEGGLEGAAVPRFSAESGA
jgi:hypothetical protein